MEKNIAVIKGDGIGPEIVTEAMKVLDAIADKYNHKFNYTQILMGGASIDVHGVPLTDEALAIAKNSDSVLLGSIGGDTTTSPWYKLEPNLRPEAGLLKIRKELGLFANLRPAVLYDELKGACPLKEELTEGGFDMMIMRELTGGLYFGERSTKEENGELVARDAMSYSETEIRRIAKRAFDIAMKRNKKVTSVDKANVIDTSRLWRKVVSEVAKDYPEVAVVIKPLPFKGESSAKASQAVLSVWKEDPKAFLALHQRLMQKKTMLDNASIDDAMKTTNTSKVKLTDESLKALQNNLDLSRKLGIQGTPATVVGDMVIPGAVDYAQLEVIVKEQLAKVKK